MGKDADPAFDADDVEKSIKKAASLGEPMNFAFGLAASAEQCGFAASRRKTGEMLGRELKAASKAIRKVCTGTFTVAADQVRLSSAKPVSGIVRQLKVRFREAGLSKYRPLLVGPDGAELNEDLLPDPDAPKAPKPMQGATPELREVTQRLGALRDALGEVAPEAHKDMADRIAAVVEQLRAGALAEAAPMVTELETALARLPKVELIPALPIFREAKETADQGVERLAAALRAHRHPALDRLADHGLTGLNGSAVHAKLMAALMDHDRATGPARAKAAATALTAAEAYRSALTADPMVAHWEANPLGIKVDVIAPLGRALDEVAAILRRSAG